MSKTRDLADLISSGDLEFTGGLNVDSGTLFVDEANNRVGVGTSSPDSKLDVDGTIRAIQQINPSSGTGLEVAYNTGADIGQILSYDRTGNNWKPLEVRSEDIRFQASGFEAARIDSSGNVGIGTSSPSRLLDLVGGSLGNGRSAMASASIGGSFQITLSNLRALTGSRNETAAVLVFYTGVDADGTDRKTILSVVEVSGASSYTGTPQENNIIGTLSASLQSSTSTSVTLNITGAGGAEGTVFALAIGRSSSIDISISA